LAPQSLIQSLIDSFPKFLSYCSPDLFHFNDCNNGVSSRNKEEERINKVFSELSSKIAAKDASEPVFLNEDLLMQLIKEAKMNLQYMRDIVQTKEYAGLFVDLTKEFAIDADAMGNYLADLKPFQLSDIVNAANAGNPKSPSVTKEQPSAASGSSGEPDYSVFNFEEHFLNLLDSSAYMCSALKISQSVYLQPTPA
jgi:hypothetical protein